MSFWKVPPEDGQEAAHTAAARACRSSSLRSHPESKEAHQNDATAAVIPRVHMRDTKIVKLAYRKAINRWAKKRAATTSTP
jgi:hypothetical protein